ncbi:MAG: hypothetical protein AABW68_04165 [archaeon]
MQAVIEIESLSQDWKPPFAKKRETKSIVVDEGANFEELKDGSPLFTLHSVQGDKILLQYSRMYTLKGYEHPTERKMWINMHSPVKFSSLWEDNGVTKTVTLRSIKVGDGETTPPVESSQTTQNAQNEDTEIYRPSA